MACALLENPRGHLPARKGRQGRDAPPGWRAPGGRGGFHGGLAKTLLNPRISGPARTLMRYSNASNLGDAARRNSGAIFLTHLDAGGTGRGPAAALRQMGHGPRRIGHVGILEGQEMDASLATHAAGRCRVGLVAFSR